MSSYIPRVQIKIFQYGVGFSENGECEKWKSSWRPSVQWPWKEGRDDRITWGDFSDDVFPSIPYSVVLSCEGIGQVMSEFSRQ